MTATEHDDGLAFRRSPRYADLEYSGTVVLHVDAGVVFEELPPCPRCHGSLDDSVRFGPGILSAASDDLPPPEVLSAAEAAMDSRIPLPLSVRCRCGFAHIDDSADGEQPRWCGEWVEVLLRPVED